MMDAIKSPKSVFAITKELDLNFFKLVISSGPVFCRDFSIYVRNGQYVYRRRSDKTEILVCKNDACFKEALPSLEVCQFCYMNRLQ